MRLAIVSAAVVGFAVCLGPAATAQRRAMAQDSSLNNLVHPAGYQTAASALGRVRKVGHGPRSMVLIPGLGFGGDVFDEFMGPREAQFTMYAVTLAGFGGTPAPPMPGPGTSYAALTWTKAAAAAIIELLDRERIGRATLVAHWIGGSQLALRLALDHPDRFDAVVLISGVAKVYYGNGGAAMLGWTPAQHAAFADGMGQRWFKTVTRRTWDDNNFMPYDYAINPLRGIFLWRAAAEPALPVWIRYLLEFYAQNLGPELAGLKVPTLVLKPGLDDPGFFVDDNRTYLTDLCVTSWSGVEGRAPAIEFASIPGSRLFIMYDRPAELAAAVDGFLAQHR